MALYEGCSHRNNSMAVVPKMFIKPPLAPNFLCTVGTFMILMTFFSLFSHCNRLCLLTLFNTAHYWHFGSTNPPPVFLSAPTTAWYKYGAWTHCIFYKPPTHYCLGIFSNPPGYSISIQSIMQLRIFSLLSSQAPLSYEPHSSEENVQFFKL